MAKIEKLTIEINFDFNLPLWTAIKARIAGKSFSNYMDFVMRELQMNNFYQNTRKPRK